MGRRWGRQIAVAMTETDEKAFMAFLRSAAEIEILTSSAKAREELLLSDLPKRSTGQTQFFLWNQRFPWEPEYAPTTAGTFYVSNISRGPVIEYDRDPLSSWRYSTGRLYWAKGITPGGAHEFQSAPYAYDAGAFEKWYESVVSWVKKNSKCERWGELPIYYLPEAWHCHAWRIHKSSLLP
jgi:hypothetical protein